MKDVTFFLCPQMLATSVTLPLEQLRAAESMALAADRRGEFKAESLRFRLASIDGHPVTTHAGMLITPDCSILDIEHSDITYLPALWRNPKPQLLRSKQLLPWLSKQHQKGEIIAGVGTGCCFMAEAGLLDHRPATTHWHYFDAFQKAYPRVKLKRDYFITQADNLFCTGSINSLADLTIFFIRQHFNAHIASHVERHFFHEIRRTPQISDYSEGKTIADETIAAAQALLQEKLQADVKIADIATTLGLSQRTFNRRFKAAVDQSPLQYLQQLRIHHARDLLQTSNLSIGEIAYRSGYQDLAHFTSLFKKVLGTTPTQYRTTVRAKLFSAN